MFCGLNFVIVEKGIGSVRAKIFHKNVEKHGGAVDEKVSDRTTHIVTSLPEPRLRDTLRRDLPPGVEVRDPEWLSSCLRTGRLVPTDHLVEHPSQPASSFSQVSSRGPSDGPPSSSADASRRTALPASESAVRPSSSKGAERVSSEEAFSRAIGTDGVSSADQSRAVLASASNGTDRDSAADAAVVPVTPSRTHIAGSAGKRPASASCAELNHPVIAKRLRFLPQDEDEDGHDPASEDELPPLPLKGFGSVSSPMAPSTGGDAMSMGKAFASTRKDAEDADARADQEAKENVISRLKELAGYYEGLGNHWRCYSYEKAITEIRKLKEPLRSGRDLLRIRGIGSKIADKVDEILETGRLRRSEYFSTDVQMQTVALFVRIWGVGPETAKRFYQAGYRTLDDLKQCPSLNTVQRIGLKYFHEFEEKIPREEVRRMEEEIRNAAEELRPDINVIACGSYRRGKAECGDCDIVVTHYDGHSHSNLVVPLVDTLRKRGFVTDDLVISADADYGDPDHWEIFQGAWLFPRDPKTGIGGVHRRVDIWIVPQTHYPCALIYLTSGTLFNRAIRLLSRQFGLRLNEKFLKKRIRVDGQERSIGEAVPLASEEDVFAALGLKYLAPHERELAGADPALLPRAEPKSV